MIVQVNDNRGINTRYANASVTVNVIRNQSPFFINTPYGLTVEEDQGQSSSIYRVTANDNDLLGTIVYRVLGDVPATSYFDVDSQTGAVSVKANLLQDRTLSYTVSSYYGLRFHIFKDEICNSVFLLLY